MFIIGLWALCAAGTAAAPLAVGGHALGDPLNQVLQDDRFECDDTAACFLYSVCAFKGAAAGSFRGAAILDLTLYFMGERLSGIRADFDSGEFDRIAEALAGELGAPVTDTATDSPNIVHLWSQGNRRLRLERFAGPTRASVIVADRSLLSEIVQR